MRFGESPLSRVLRVPGPRGRRRWGRSAHRKTSRELEGPEPRIRRGTPIPSGAELPGTTPHLLHWTPSRDAHLIVGPPRRRVGEDSLPPRGFTVSEIRERRVEGRPSSKPSSGPAAPSLPLSGGLSFPSPFRRDPQNEWGVGPRREDRTWHPRGGRVRPEPRPVSPLRFEGGRGRAPEPPSRSRPRRPSGGLPLYTGKWKCEATAVDLVTEAPARVPTRARPAAARRRP